MGAWLLPRGFFDSEFAALFDKKQSDGSFCLLDLNDPSFPSEKHLACLTHQNRLFTAVVYDPLFSRVQLYCNSGSYRNNVRF